VILIGWIRNLKKALTASALMQIDIQLIVGDGDPLAVKFLFDLLIEIEAQR
jgi:hypothetical protein